MKKTIRMKFYYNQHQWSLQTSMQTTKFPSRGHEKPAHVYVWRMNARGAQVAEFKTDVCRAEIYLYSRLDIGGRKMQ